MHNCSEFTENISAYFDGELTKNESDRMFEHLSACPDCKNLHDECGEIHKAFSDGLVTPPDFFCSDIMAKISLTDSVKSKKTRNPGFLYKFAAIAACFAVVVFTALHFTSLRQTGSIAPMKNEELEIAADTYGFKSSGAENAENIEGNINEYSNSPRDEYDAGLSSKPDNKLKSGEHSESPASVNAGAAEPAEPPALPPAAMGGSEYKPGGAYSAAPESLTRDESYYSVVTIRGALPDILLDYEQETASDGTVRIYVDRELADTLTNDGYDTVFDDKSLTTSLVIFTE